VPLQMSSRYTALADEEVPRDVPDGVTKESKEDKDSDGDDDEDVHWYPTPTVPRLPCPKCCVVVEQGDSKCKMCGTAAPEEWPDLPQHADTEQAQQPATKGTRSKKKSARRPSQEEQLTQAVGERDNTASPVKKRTKSKSRQQVLLTNASQRSPDRQSSNNTGNQERRGDPGGGIKELFPGPRGGPTTGPQ
jgi:hypothetical protein